MRYGAVVLCSLLIAVLAAGCMKTIPDECYSPGETIWLYEYAVVTEACDCFVERRQTEWACATSYSMAADRTDTLVMVTPGVRSYRLVNCMDTHTGYPQAMEPDMVIRPVCEADPDDDDCAVCAKASCCEELSACADDPGCAGWIDCLSADGDTPLCSSVELSGPVDGVTQPIAACLEQSCAAQCPGLGSLGGARTSRAPASERGIP
ncbi:hypothetical protein [Sorangium sp. So ce426]|uniref:hypothetical protein n=1 Tax=Sorangium sp. So ce426 TaxID=3133312 RepID=UPI003F5BAB82